MKRTLTISVLLLVLTSCASGFNRLNDYNSITAPNKAMAVAINSYGELTGGYGFAGGYTLSYARSEALKKCKSFNRQSTCIIERENNTYVFNQVIASYRKQQNYTDSSSNYSSSSQSQQKSTIDKCLEKMEEARDKFETGCSFTEKTYQSGLSGLLDVMGKCKQKAEAQFPDMACYGASLPNIQNQDICNFKCRSSGAIIRGDCNKSRIDFGGKACYKMN